jgi:acetyl-CoA/propionyl-CoA carboxylase, biotin carboxylase, biotin carboxyl carrier protein
MDAPGTTQVPGLRFGSVLVANRGEIAIRVLRAARQAGLRTVAVYSDADRSAPHLREADTAVRIGPPPATDSYLSIPALLEAAHRSGADAVHPGYGFLSERAAFARAVGEAGLIFIGPPAEVMELMGRKDAAREVASSAGIPVVPSHPLSRSNELGLADFPVLVKAAAGGGGKGMRIVRDPAALADAVAAARREAAAAFGDDTILVEKFVERGRHIEVQILADSHGNVVHLFERDCSVQRRHQKVVEEAPAPTISTGVRNAVTDAAVRLAKQVRYLNAGTVEFLVAGENAFFLEMNTRLQVEHAVTELITGRDLVQAQFSIAQGLPLPFGQHDVTIEGHAIEARVYAEDPYHGFLPQAGVASRVHWPERARVDAALESGQRVDTYYDPMLGKIIVHAPTRESARRALIGALDDTAILGLTTNLGFLRQLADDPAYRAAEVDSGWLDRNAGQFRDEPDDLAACIAAWTLAGKRVEASGDGDPRDPFGVGDGWRSAGPSAPVLVELRSGDQISVLKVDEPAGFVAVDDQVWAVRELAETDDFYRLEIDGVVHEAYVEIDRHGVTVAHHGRISRLQRPDVFGPMPALAVSDGTVTAPMPGTILSLRVSTGQPVSTGETLGVMEAMKMELSLTAPVDGVVAEIGAAEGDQVPMGQALFRVTGDQSD